MGRSVTRSSADMFSDSGAESRAGAEAPLAGRPHTTKAWHVKPGSLEWSEDTQLLCYSSPKRERRSRLNIQETVPASKCWNYGCLLVKWTHVAACDGVQLINIWSFSNTVIKYKFEVFLLEYVHFHPATFLRVHIVLFTPLHLCYWAKAGQINFLNQKSKTKQHWF